MNSRQETGRADPVAERPANLTDADLEDRIAHDGARPDAFEEDVLRDELAVALDETLQHRKGLWRQVNRPRATPKTGVGRVEVKRREAKQPRRFHIHWRRLIKFLPRDYDPPSRRP